MVYIRPKIKLQRHQPVVPVISILHPDYAPHENTLLEFRALDDGGLDYDTALVACGILAGNKWTGFFAKQSPASGSNLVRVARPADGVLRGNDAYYFQLPDADAGERPFPVVVRFRDWRFPHNDLPPLWRQLAAVIASDDGNVTSQSCSLTDSRWSVERAHLVPLSESDWWTREKLRQYASLYSFSQRNINTDSNIIGLRVDMHRLFDNKAFAFLPKRSVTSTAQGSQAQEPSTSAAQGSLAAQGSQISLVAHVFNLHPDNHFNLTYHNQEAVLPTGCRVEYLFARFAWTIFSELLCGFLTDCDTKRRILVPERDDKQSTTKVEECNSEQARAIFNASQSRSVSPKKRSAGEMAGAADELAESSWYDDGRADSGFGEESPERGRPMKRGRRGPSPWRLAGLLPDYSRI